MYYILIKFLSFNSEFNKMNSHIPDKEFQQNAKNILRGIMRKWPDMNAYRGEIVAHEFRDKKNKNSIFSRDNRRYLIPTTAPDYKELVDAMSNIKQVFKRKISRSFLQHLKITKYY